MKLNKKIILIVDDDPFLARGTKENLQDDGFVVFEAYDGLTGIKIAKKHKPNLIILDVAMPKLNGFKICSMLKKDPKTKDIVIILFTGGVNDTESEEKAKRLADAFIIKGSQYTELLDKINSLI